MTKEQLWKKYTSNNPKWETGGANLTANGLKKLFEQTYDLAHSEGIVNGRVLGEKQEREKQEKYTSENLLASLLGMKSR